MKLLAIETATEACSAALLIEGEVRERFEVAPRRHAELILPMIDALLAEAQLSLSALDALAFGRGPGAFTGVRIATGIVQGLAFGADLPVVPVSSLAALARGALREQEATQVLAALDARMNEVYWGVYVAPGGDALEDMRLIGTEQVGSPQDAMADLRAQMGAHPHAHWLGAGSGWLAYADMGTVAGLDATHVIPLPDALPHATEVAVLGAQGFVDGQAVAAEQALPVYLRNEVAWKRRVPPVVSPDAAPVSSR